MTAFRPELARRLAGAALEGALRRGRRRDRDFVLRLDHPSSAEEGPRYGYGRPPHSQLAELLDRHCDRYREQLALLARYEEDLLAIGRGRSDDPLEPYWDQYWFFGLDAISLYGFIRSREPPA